MSTCNDSRRGTPMVLSGISELSPHASERSLAPLTAIRRGDRTDCKRIEHVNASSQAPRATCNEARAAALRDGTCNSRQGQYEPDNH